MKWLLLFATMLFALEPRSDPLALKTSIIIPCHPDHFRLLTPLLECYAHQTALPDEIVISLSEAQRVAPSELLALEQAPWPFALVLLKHSQKYPPGKNRNEACAKARGDLILCQDADDLPHPQRVEIVRYLFSYYKLEHLLHQWAPPGVPLAQYNVEEAAAFCRTFRSYEQIDVTEVHNGSVAFLRPLFDKLRWQPLPGRINEDVLFNRTAYAFCMHKAVLPWPLLVYRTELSTFDLDGTKGQSQHPLSQ